MRLKRKTVSTVSSPDWKEVDRLVAAAKELPKSKRLKWLRAQTKDFEVITAVISALQKRKLSTRTSKRTKVVKLRERVAEVKKAEEVVPPTIMKSLGDFEITKVLGEGNLATVYLARQISLDREVALKVSRDTGNEGQVLAILEHDHIVRMYSESHLEDPDIKLVCMQYVPGITLRKIIEKLNRSVANDIAGREMLDLIDHSVGTFTINNPTALRFRDLLSQLDRIDLALWTGAKLADALAHAHSKGILHLDVKPSNILFSIYGRPMLTDFNVSLDARNRAADGHVGIGGTFGYMSPEQRRIFDLTPDARSQAADKIDGRADIYSLGVVIRELLALSAKTPILDDRDRFIYGETTKLLNRCMAADPANRFESAAEVCDAFTHLIELRKILYQMPKTGKVGRFIQAYPLTAISTIGAVPQMVAITVGILYNKARIISHLNLAQKAWFDWLNNYCNPAVSVVIVSLWTYYLYRIHKAQERLTVSNVDTGEVSQTRNRVLNIPKWGILASSMGWLVSAILFPTVLHVKGGELSKSTVFHFLVSFFISWSISATYTFLLSQYCVMRFMYPRLLIGSFRIQQTTTLELTDRWSFHQVEKLTVAIPLLSVMLLFSRSDFVNPEQLENFRILILSLIASGMVGSFFAFNIKHACDRLYYALTNAKQK